MPKKTKAKSVWDGVWIVKRMFSANNHAYKYTLGMVSVISILL
jgi:hypothetical protein